MESGKQEPMEPGEQKLDSAICAQHGLRYDSALHQGCLICRRMTDTSPPVEPGPRAGTPQSKARGWLLAISIMTLLFGIGMFFVQRSATERQIEEAARATAHLAPAELDAHLQREIGMTWEQAKRHDRGMVRMMLAVNVALCGIYLALWWWARKNALASAIIALLLFITVNVVNAVLEPKSMGQGVVIKILFVLALVKAIQAALREQKLYSTPPPP